MIEFSGFVDFFFLDDSEVDVGVPRASSVSRAITVVGLWSISVMGIGLL